MGAKLIDQPEPGARTVLEWVSCPECSTTFRVAVPSHYPKIDILDEDPLDPDSSIFHEYEMYATVSQAVACPIIECQGELFLHLQTS